MNIAALWKLPAVFLVEQNGIAQTTPTELQMAGSVAGRCAAFGIPVATISGTDLDETLATASRVIDAVRAEQRPHCLVSHAIRLGPHSKGDDTRHPSALQAAWAKDPVLRLQQKVGTAAAAIDREVAELIRAALAVALAEKGAP
jgi:pyruvate dehydrogenase E1 component alpha subunit